jgi:hypothetical protein
MPRRLQSGFALTAILVFAVWLSASSSGFAQRAGPFVRLAGSWSGGGTIDLSDGKRERIRCRAAYDAQSRNLELSIRCASDSYNFDLRGSITLASNTVTGSWSEATHGISGDVSGRASGDHIYVLARSPSFTATMSLVTHGSRQSVVIRSQDPNSGIKGVSISLRRG